MARSPGWTAVVPSRRVWICAGIALVCVGTFAGAAILAPRPGTIDRPLAMVAADFDRDGFQDLAIANFDAGTITVLINQRDGTFAPQASSPSPVGAATSGSPTNGPLRMALGELNPGDTDGDGVPNLVLDASGKRDPTKSDDCPNVYNPIDATTGLQPDKDLDGIGDACAILGTDPAGNPVTIDTDGDGIPDFDPIKLSLDNCPLIYNPLQEDANNDGVGDACSISPDLVVLGTSLGSGSPLGIIRTRLNDGAGGFNALFSKVGAVGPADILLADFNNDGVLDMIASNAGSNELQLFNGSSDGTFGTQQLLTSSGGPEGMAAGDFNGDFACDLGASANKNLCDLAVANRSADTISFYFNTGSGLPSQPSPSPPPLRTTGGQPTTLLSAKLNGDAYTDLVVLEQGGSGDGMIEVFLGSATGTMTSAGPAIDLGNGHRPFGGVLADLDKDGQLDLAVTDFTGGQILIYRGAGDGTFALSKTLGGMVNPAAVVMLDYDTDYSKDPSVPHPDLAVLDFATNRIELFQYGPGLDFTPAPTSPVSAWMDRPSVPQPEISGLQIYGADREVGNDVVLLHRSPPRLDVLSGLGTGFFRTTPVIPLKGLLSADGMVLGDLREDTFFDLAVLGSRMVCSNATDTACAVDASCPVGGVCQVAGALTVVTGDPAGPPVARETVTVPGGTPSSAAIGSMISNLADYDRDGVPDVLDDCPTRYNPPGCTGTCGAQAPLCIGDSRVPIDCLRTDPTTGQCDSDGNGIGDACQLLGASCENLDSDGDLKLDYDPGAIALTPVGGLPDFDKDTVPNVSDNCPTVSNPPDNNGVQDPTRCEDTGDPDGDLIPDFDPVTLKHDNCPLVYNPGQEDNDNDGVGNACVLAAALDNCPWTPNRTQADTGNVGAIQAGLRGNNVGDACDFPVNDLALVSPSTGTVSLLIGDATGNFRSGAFPQISGLTNPSAAVVAPLTLVCDPVTGAACSLLSTSDILIAEQRTVPDPNDDLLHLYHGNGSGLFYRSGSTGAQGDPTALAEIDAQRVCADPTGPGFGLHFDLSGKSNLVVAVEPGTSTLQVFVASNSGIVTPPAGRPLPVPATLVDLAHVDLNRDGIEDLVALSSDTGTPPTSSITIYMGIGNGLYFTDPSLNLTGLKNGATKIDTGFIDINTDVVYPDVVIFNHTDAQPLVLLNTMRERADIDGSKRIDGFDLAILARAFGSTRGEDFTIQPDGTLQQSGSGYSSLVVGSGVSTIGQDLCQLADPSQPSSLCICNETLDPLTGLYGLPADINLDGKVDGLDLALLASMFGRRL